MTKKWSINERGIIRSVEAVLKSGNINKLTKDAYNFVMNISGFIAHYNHQGFMAEYQNVADLWKNLERSCDISDAERYIKDDYFGKGEQKEYYRSKSNILLAIREMLPKYGRGLFESEKRVIDDKIGLLAELAKRAKDDKVFAKTILQKLQMI